MRHFRIAVILRPGALLGGVALAAGLLGPGQADAASIKCWTNDEGIRECGNAVPPRYSQKGHRKISAQGVTISSQERAKTREELQAEAREKRAREVAEARQARLDEEQHSRDRVLLDTFTTEDDLVLAHQGRLAAIDSRVNHTRQIVDALRRDLGQLREKAAEQERSGKGLSDELEAKIADIQQRIDEHLSFIAERHDEKAELDRQFEQDLARYRRLRRRAPLETTSR